MLGWWAGWHGLDPLRYALWNPDDHYGLKVVKNRERLLDDAVAPGERVWTTTHRILESYFLMCYSVNRIMEPLIELALPFFRVIESLVFIA